MSRFLAVLALIGSLLCLSDSALAAAYFWIGGAGTWDNSSTANWSATTGGSGGAGPPTSADTATFDANSGTGTVTINAGAATSALTGGKAGIVYAFGAGVTFGAVTVTAGTFTTGAFTHNFTSFSSTTGTRTLTLDNSTINITATSGTGWNIATAGALTFSATGSTINFTGGGAGQQVVLTFASLTYGAIAITGSGAWVTSAVTAAAFSYTSTTYKLDTLKVNGTITISAAGSLTLAGNSSVNRAFVNSNLFGTQRTISVPSGATVTATNVDFQDINMAGTFSTGATASSIGDALGNTFGWSSVQPDVSVTQSYTGTGGADNWSTAAVWTSRVPLPQDDVTLPAAAAGSVLTADMPRMGRNITSTNYTRTLSFNSAINTIFGNIALGASGTYSGTLALTLAGRGAQTITNNGKAFSQNVTVTAFGGSYTQQDDFSADANVFTLSNGTWNDAGFSVAASSFASPSALTRAINATGTWSLSGTSGTLWNVASTLTVTSAPAIKFTGTVSTTATFAGAGFTYPSVYWSSPASTGTLIITGANTIGTLQIDGTTARTVQFPASTVTTVRRFIASGSGPTARITLNSSTPSTLATLQSSGRQVSGDYLSITDINALGGAGWFAGNNSISGGNNYGWQFHPPASIILHGFQKNSANDNWPLDRMAA